MKGHRNVLQHIIKTPNRVFIKAHRFVLLRMVKTKYTCVSLKEHRNIQPH